MADSLSEARLILAEHPRGEEIASLLVAAHEGYEREHEKHTRAIEHADRENDYTWALAYVLADIMDGKPVDDVVDDLPSEVRRRVIAIRHQGGPFGRVPPRDQYGRLPVPPPRASVMRERVRIVDVDPYVSDVPPGSQLDNLRQPPI